MARAASVCDHRGTREMGCEGPTGGLMLWSGDLWLKDFHLDQVCISVGSGMRGQGEAGRTGNGRCLQVSREGDAHAATGLLSCKT